MFAPKYISCPDCGALVTRDAMLGHECDPERRATFMFFQLHDEVQSLETKWNQYLDTAGGRFEMWLAKRQINQKGHGPCA